MCEPRDVRHRPGRHRCGEVRIGRPRVAPCTRGLRAGIGEGDMKFSDMMGKRDRGTADVEPQLPPEAATAPPVPEAPIRFVGNRTELDAAAAAFGGGSITPPAPPAPP